MGPNDYTPRSFMNFKPKWKDWVFRNRDSMERYRELLKFIHGEKKAEWEDYYKIVSMCCENEDDYAVLKDFLVAAKTPMGKAVVKVSGTFEGPGYYGYEMTDNEPDEDNPRIIDIVVYKLN